MNRMTIFPTNANSPLRRILRRGVYIGTAASIGAFAMLCHAQSEVPATNQATAAEGPSIATCVACHGVLGAGSETDAPRLAGKDPDYLAHALSMFKAGTRISPQMQAVAQNLSESDIRTLAVFFSKQHPPLAPTSVPPTALVTAGKQLAETGAGISVQACFSCHGAGGKGNGARFPGIAGEPAAFTIARLHEFQARAKTSTPKPGSMTAVAASLNDTQIEQVAAYLSVTAP
ncbi:c-type cytochrome [Pararobbsia alpina]|uniref:Cytochrome c4 n=1 Tax=Pararobbsia alpina TaxID=621374 RepID=A0A6S7BMG0_9BURK|nr:c-type cytochrome [Pararobbsia alpina]CAB3805686.1 Cytochrome c4 [Pararobbsia alpina]